MRVTPTEKLFLTANTQNNWIFLSLYFCGYFSEGTSSEKYFSDGIRIFLCVFAHTEKCEIPVVYAAADKAVNPLSPRSLFVVSCDVTQHGPRARWTNCVLCACVLFFFLIYDFFTLSIVSVIIAILATCMCDLTNKMFRTWKTSWIFEMIRKFL